MRYISIRSILVLAGLGLGIVVTACHHEGNPRPTPDVPAGAEQGWEDEYGESDESTTSISSFQEKCPKRSESKFKVTPLRGVYVSNVDSTALYSRAEMSQAFQAMKDRHLNAAFPVIWNKGILFYQRGNSKSRFEAKFGVSPYGDRYPGMNGRDILAEALEIGREKGIRVIPWFEYGFKVHANDELIRKRPELFSQKNNGTVIEEVHGMRFAYMNPFHPEVQQMVQEIALDVVTQYPVDGIQFDDHFSLPSEWGYDSYTRARYRAEHQGSEPADNEEWTRWRAAKITQFVRKLVAEIRRVRPDAKIVLSPNPWRFSYVRLLQDWKTWREEGLVDEIILQLYRRSRSNFIADLTKPEIQEAMACIPVSAALLTESYAANGNNPLSIPEQLQLMDQNGFDGAAFFHFGTLLRNLPLNFLAP